MPRAFCLNVFDITQRADAFCLHGANGVTADVSEEHHKIFMPCRQNIEVVLEMCECICVLYDMNCMSCTVFSS